MSSVRIEKYTIDKIHACYLHNFIFVVDILTPLFSTMVPPCYVSSVSPLSHYYFIIHQGHPHAAGELWSGARQPERAGIGQDEGHGH